MELKNYDVVIVGGGVTGTSLAYMLSNFTTVKKIAILEKYSHFSQVNSHKNNNSQTLHFGDIETNYTLEKARRVKEAADMVKTYVKSASNKKDLFLKTHKMVLGVGREEVEELTKRYEEFKELFPKLRKIDRKEIARVEPKMTEGRNPQEELLALCTEEGYAINYEKLSESFVAQALEKKKVDILLDTRVISITKKYKEYLIKTKEYNLQATVVVVAAGSHSLIFAQSLGYGKEFGILPVAGSFYYSPKTLHGKVYTLQMKKLPFAAIHGDPDVENPAETRFGPTAKVLPLLERHKYRTIPDFLKTSAFTIDGILSLLKIISDPVLFHYILKNFIYDLPFIGKRIFLKEVQKIVPSMTSRQLRFGKGLGGIRPQIVDTKTRKLNMGEAKILGDNIIFNITPSPGASMCLKNAENDARTIVNFLQNKVVFNEKEFSKFFLKER